MIQERGRIGVYVTSVKAICESKMQKHSEGVTDMHTLVINHTMYDTDHL